MDDLRQVDCITKLCQHMDFSQLGIVCNVIVDPKISREVSPLWTLFALLELTRISLILSQS